MLNCNAIINLDRLIQFFTHIDLCIKHGLYKQRKTFGYEENSGYYTHLQIQF
jgi:hypothetical protein